MKRIEVYRNILKHILSLSTGVSAIDKETLEYSVVNDAFNAIDFEKIKTGLPPGHDGCASLMDKIKNLVIDHNSDLINCNCNKYIFIKETEIKKVYKFNYETANLICLNASSLYNTPLSDDILSAIEHICCDNTQIPDFISKLDDVTFRDDVLIVFDPIVHIDFGNNPKRDYSYTVLQYLYSTKKFELDGNLAPVRFPIENLNYVKDTEYCQYFDIFDIINDWNHAENLLDSFLRMYHIIEYMAYRMDVVKIAKGAVLKKSFLRQIKNLDKAYQTNERSKIVNGYCSIFKQAKLSAGDLLGDNTDTGFCEKYFPKENDLAYFTSADLSTTNQNKLLKITARFIYDVRCMIVHSKESEFHITLTNYNEYSAIVPLMRKIIERVHLELKTILGDNTNGIRFDESVIELY